MASEDAAGIIDLYQSKAEDWIESRARSSLFENPVSHVVEDAGCGGHTIWLAQRI